MAPRPGWGTSAALLPSTPPPPGPHTSLLDALGDDGRQGEFLWKRVQPVEFEEKQQVDGDMHRDLVQRHFVGHG